jgi:broad specificity phosphatase PhoE
MEYFFTLAKIFLTRHGESIANTFAEHYYASRMPDHLISLTDNGIAQANEAGKWLADYCAQNNIAFVSCSAGFIICPNGLPSKRPRKTVGYT